MVDVEVFYAVGTALVIIGIAAIIIAVIRASMGGEKEGRVRGAGVIMIGPIPIIFGTDKKSVKTVLALAVALSVVVLIILVVYYWLLR
jgi:uncharacterized protein (TIGR00304 family)